MQYLEISCLKLIAMKSILWVLSLILSVLVANSACSQDLLDGEGNKLMTVDKKGDVVYTNQRTNNKIVVLEHDPSGGIRRQKANAHSVVEFSSDTIYESDGSVLGWITSNRTVYMFNGDPLGTIQTVGNSKVIYDQNNDVIGKVNDKSLSDNFLAFFYFYYMQDL